ncbi:MAG: type II toxin-antitoxin system RelE/ParE family toxin [Acidobacteriota bacterium]
MKRYLLTETAEGELEEILFFIAERDGRGRAERVLVRLLDAFDHLTSSPGIGHRKRRLTGGTLRWWPVYRFLILYDPEAEPLTVMRILHSSRDLDQIFSGEP